jgi:hypothetical protein
LVFCADDVYQTYGETVMSTKPKSDSVTDEQVPTPAQEAGDTSPLAEAVPEKAPLEKGGRGGLEPTRYGDWEVGGICSDF